MRLWVVVTTVAALSFGCGTGKQWNGEFFRVDKFATDPRTDVANPVDLAAICFPEDVGSDGKCGATAYKKAATDAGARNRLQAYLMAASDAQCSIHASAILNTSTNVNLLTGLAALGLGAAAPLIKPIVTKNAFAAGAALATGSKSLYNDEVYKQMLVTTVLKAIADTKRAQAVIIQTRQRDTIAEYSVDAAILDVVDYHDRCSFYRGLTELSQAVEKKATCSGVGARRDALVARLAVAGLSDEGKKSYQQELAVVNKQIAECQ